MFDAALLESRRGHRPGDRKKSLPLAIALHAATIGIFVGAATWNTGEPPEPVIPVVFPVPAPPPPPLGTGGSHVPTAHRGASPNSVVAPVAPIQAVLPVVTELDRTAPEEPDFEGPEEQGPPGDTRGQPDGTGHLPVVGSGTAVGDAPIPVGGDVKAPVLLLRIEPEYPESMRIGRKEGVVILEAVITTSGEVDDVRVLKSEGAILDRAAADAVRRWRYQPDPEWTRRHRLPDRHRPVRAAFLTNVGAPARGAKIRGAEATCESSRSWHRSSSSPRRRASSPRI